MSSPYGRTSSEALTHHYLVELAPDPTDEAPDGFAWVLPRDYSPAVLAEPSPAWPWLVGFAA